MLFQDMVVISMERQLKIQFLKFQSRKQKLGWGLINFQKKIRTSSVLSGNELAILASYEDIPKKDPDFVCNLTSLQTHGEAKKLINMSQVDLAWQYLVHD